MSNTFSETITIQTQPEVVWSVLSNIGDIYRWNPGVKASHTTSDRVKGIGATRYCDLGGKNFLDEEVVVWEPESKLTMRITGTNMPFKTADIRFTLQNKGNQTEVTVSPIYQLKYGPIGQLLDRFYVQNTYQKGMAALLAGLKNYVENEMENK
ncbi:MAG: SRPBCC family protein [Ardenticatenaceae bacterium]|nr:SRPBCC family protein [Ardenticatenaceae bacterium]